MPASPQPIAPTVPVSALQMRLPAYAITLPPVHAASVVWLGRDLTIRRWRPQRLGVGDWLALHAGQMGGAGAHRAALRRLGEEAVWAGRYTDWRIGRYIPDRTHYPGLRLLFLTLWGRGPAALVSQPETCSFSKGFAFNPTHTHRPPRPHGRWPGSWPIYTQAIVGIVRIGRIDEGSSTSPWDQGDLTDAASPAGGRSAPQNPQPSLFADTTPAPAPARRPQANRLRVTERRWVLRFDRIFRLHRPPGGVCGHPRYWPVPTDSQLLSAVSEVPLQ